MKLKNPNVTFISYMDAKKGDFVQLENDERVFVCVPHGQAFHFIPIRMHEEKIYNIHDINKPKIKRIYDGKNGACKMNLVEVNKDV